MMVPKNDEPLIYLFLDANLLGNVCLINHMKYDSSMIPSCQPFEVLCLARACGGQLVPNRSLLTTDQVEGFSTK